MILYAERKRCKDKKKFEIANMVLRRSSFSWPLLDGNFFDDLRRIL